MDTTSKLLPKLATPEVAYRSGLRTEILPPLLCCLALLACVAIANPFVNSAFNDDWSYADVALRLAQTGHVHYNGWGSPTVLFQCVWAAIFIKVFGFSFNLLRFVTLPFSLGFVCLTYFLGRQLGLRRDFATFAALVLAVSPIYIPVAASFMTEPYACFFTLLCIYAAIEAAKGSPSRATLWLWVLTVSGILGGSDRQTVWLLPVLEIPYVAWVKRRSGRFLTSAAAAYLLCLACLAFILVNFNTKYAADDLSRELWISVIRTAFTRAVHSIMSVLLVVALMCLPALLSVWPLRRYVSIGALAGIFIACLFAFDYFRSGLGEQLGVAPFIGNLLNPGGILASESGLGSRPKILHNSERYLITFLLVFSTATYAYLYRKLSLREGIARRTSTILLIFVVPYVCLLFPGALLGFCYDRYAIPLVPIAAILIMLPCQNAVRKLPLAAWAGALVFAIYGIATTHDYARESQARAATLELCKRKGIPESHLSAGLEQDFWRQARDVGTVEHVRFGANPTFSYNQFGFWMYTPSITPIYVSLASSLAEVPKTAIVTVPFRSWLPLSRRAVFVVKRTDIPNPNS